MIFGPLKVNEPMIATIFFSCAWRAQAAPMFGSPLSSQSVTSSLRPLMPPFELIHSA